MQVVITDKDIPGASVKVYNYEDLLKYRAPMDAFDVVWTDGVWA